MVQGKALETVPNEIPTSYDSEQASRAFVFVMWAARECGVLGVRAIVPMPPHVLGFEVDATEAQARSFALLVQDTLGCTVCVWEGS